MKIEKNKLTDKIREMKNKGFDYLVKITAVDYNDHLEVIYIIRNIDLSKDEILEVELKGKELSIPTIIDIYKSADWYERELYEMFDIKVSGRKNNRLLLERWDGVDAPLRKSFSWGSDYKTDQN